MCAVRLDLADLEQNTVASCIERALGNLAHRQEERGSWAGDYGGPMFLLPMYLALCHAAKQAAALGRSGW